MTTVVGEPRDGSVSPQSDAGGTPESEKVPVPQPPATAAPPVNTVAVLVKKKRVKSPSQYTVPVLPAVEKPSWKRKVVRVAKKRVNPESAQREKIHGIDDVESHPRGPLVDGRGHVIEHSYLGSKEDFDAYAERYREYLTPLSPAQEHSTTVKSQHVEGEASDSQGGRNNGVTSSAHGHLLIYQRMLQLRDEHALCNWTQHNEVWKKQQAYLARRLNTTIDELVMSRNEEYREIIEERLVIERAIPILEKGLGDFWRTNLQIGSALTGLSMPVTKSQRGEPPDIVHVGKPRAIHEEQQYQSRNNLNYPWKDSVYLADRRRQLRELLDAIDPHAPDIAELQVVANGLTDINGLKSMLESNKPGGTGDECPDESDPVTEESKVPGANTDADTTACRLSLLVERDRIVLEAQTGTCTRRHLLVENNGTISLRYYFVQERSSNTNHAMYSRDLGSCFYFDPNERIILPGERAKIPFHFKSEHAGIFTERWQIVTSPSLAGIQPLGPITLRGIATEDDVLEPKRNAIERMLQQRAPTTFINRMVQDLVDIVPVVARMQQKQRANGGNKVAVDDSSEVKFRRENTGLNLHFHRDVVNSLRDLAIEISASAAKEAVAATPTPPPVLLTEVESEDEPEAEDAPAFVWNFSIASLNEMILTADVESEEKRESYMKRFNELVEKLYHEVHEVVNNEADKLTARLICQLSEKIATTLMSGKARGEPTATTVGGASDPATGAVETSEEVEAVKPPAKETSPIIHAHVLDTIKSFANMIVSL